MAESLIDFHLKRVVIRSGLPQDAPDNLNLRVVERGLAINALSLRPGNGPVVPYPWDRFANIDGLDGIRSLRQEWMMESARADVPDDQSCVGGELPLDAQVPLVYIIAFNIVVVVSPDNLRRFHRRRKGRDSIRPHTCGRRGRARWTDRTVATQERSGCRVIEIVDIRLGQGIK